ncbi:hypothetical protein CDAR_206111 [Caerostris darwini]|uniref:Uncharacterized protein n=1 Tax=Caerostris darwini TaxID=1538125 RepID=A0AAV4VWW5_9ARAC|nr:hypothetical protein CDAR_206111 [Caerostris darwini]
MEDGSWNISGLVPPAFQLSAALLFGSLFGVHLNEKSVPPKHPLVHQNNRNTVRDSVSQTKNSYTIPGVHDKYLYRIRPFIGITDSGEVHEPPNITHG